MLKHFPASDLCTRRLSSSGRCRLVDAGGGVSERGPIADGGAKRPLGGPRLSGEIISDPTIGLS